MVAGPTAVRTADTITMAWRAARRRSAAGAQADAATRSAGCALQADDPRRGEEQRERRLPLQTWKRAGLQGWVFAALLPGRRGLCRRRRRSSVGGSRVLGDRVDQLRPDLARHVVAHAF